MKQFLAILLTVCLLLAVGVYGQQPDEAALDGVITALSDGGFVVTVTEEAPDFLRGERHRLLLNGQEQSGLTVYLYKDEAEAQREAGFLKPDGFGLEYVDRQGMGHGVAVEWIDEPHFFCCENLIVQYIGSDEDVLAILQSVCGEQVAGAPIRHDTPSFVEMEPWMSCPAPDYAVSLEVAWASGKGLQVTLRNDSDRTVEYGAAYELLQKRTDSLCGVAKADGEQSVSEEVVSWEPVSMDEIYFPSIGYMLPAGRQAELQAVPPELEPGEYRLTKTVRCQQDGQSGMTAFEVYADFVVPEEK